MNWPWSELGLSGPADLPQVRRAYAERLKTTHPEEDPEGFQRLHEAYQQARRLAKKGGVGERSAPPSRQTPPPEQLKEPEETSEENSEDESDWDYDGLLQKEAPGEEPEEEEPDWDYEGIFTELADERARERQAHAEERREAYFARHSPTSPEERERLEKQWIHVEKAGAAVEELYASGAPLYIWDNFLHSSVFFAVKGDEDFIVGLEEFLRRAPDLDQQIKTELIKAFNLRRPNVPSLWRGLQELLVEYTPSEAEKQAKRRQEEMREKGRKTWSKAQKAALALGLIAAVFLLALVIFLAFLSERPGQRERELLCRYMEEDFGQKIESHWKGRDNYENLYAPWDQPDLTFMAWPDGERDLESGKRGYTTNYSSVMVTEALRGFAKEWLYELELLQEGGCDGVMGTYGTSPGAYVLKLPLQGAEDGLAALGDLMAELEGERWYQAFPPSYKIYFAYQNLTYLVYSSEGPFSAAAVVDYYENEAGTALCQFLVEQTGLAQEDFGGDGFRLEPQGTVELAERTWFLVSGLDESSGETVRQYIFDGAYLTSLPAEEFSLDLKTYQLSGGRFNSTWEDVPRFLWISRR